MLLRVFVVAVAVTLVVCASVLWTVFVIARVVERDLEDEGW